MTDTESKTKAPETLEVAVPMELEEGEIKDAEPTPTPTAGKDVAEAAPLKRKRAPKAAPPSEGMGMDSEKMAGLIAAAVKAELAALKQMEPPAQKEAPPEEVEPAKKRVKTSKTSKAPTVKGKPQKPSGSSTTSSLKNQKKQVSQTLGKKGKTIAGARGGATSLKKSKAGNAYVAARGVAAKKKPAANVRAVKSVKPTTKPLTKAAKGSTSNTDSVPKPRASPAVHQVTPHQQKLNALYSSIFS